MYDRNVSMKPWTKEEQYSFNTAVIYNGKFDKDRERDHDDLYAIYIGTAHTYYHWKYKHPTFLPFLYTI